MAFKVLKLTFVTSKEEVQTISMFLNEKFPMVLRFAFVFLLLLAAMASTGQCTRDLKDDGVFKSVFQNQLPRGPVPPSMPSPCHNKLDPYRQSDASYPQDLGGPAVVADGNGCQRLPVVVDGREMVAVEGNGLYPSRCIYKFPGSI
ncbi:hypothetical protein RJ640_006994 [Escallonia rubra]|uniref:Uncharacterized protein n=1 Tax=Escallonia rubra TaxID=112253 RepID=A0AA88R8E0_9ASTE|nr:hypothetical protein RJ640_006994 [Escallonia rubra]